MSPTIAQRLAQHLRSHPFYLPDTNADTMLEWLYTCYTETQERDPPEINQCFINLGTHLEQLPLAENNAIFAIVCELCNAYEKRAFMDAIKLGAYLMTELQEK
jgi:hypothetical protein